MSEDKKNEEDGGKPEAVPKSYRERLKTLRKGQEYYSQDDLPKAVDCYTQYLHAIAKYHKVDEAKLSPKFFDKEKDLAELLLISHVYWDLAKAYDRSPKLNSESIRCLDQFVKFTSGFKYQYVNARMLRNYIRKRMAHNLKAFKQAYDRIQVESKGCFVATDLYGYYHPYTIELRKFKNSIYRYRIGRSFVIFYYHYFCPAYFKLQDKGILGTSSIFHKILKFFIKSIVLIRVAFKK